MIFCLHNKQTSQMKHTEKTSLIDDNEQKRRLKKHLPLLSDRSFWKV